MAGFKILINFTLSRNGIRYQRTTICLTIDFFIALFLQNLIYMRLNYDWALRIEILSSSRATPRACKRRLAGFERTRVLPRLIGLIYSLTIDRAII